MDETTYIREIMSLRAELCALKIHAAKQEMLVANYEHFIESNLKKDQEFLALYGEKV